MGKLLAAIVFGVSIGASSGAVVFFLLNDREPAAAAVTPPSGDGDKRIDSLAAKSLDIDKRLSAIEGIPVTVSEYLKELEKTIYIKIEAAILHGERLEYGSTPEFEGFHKRYNDKWK